MLRVTVWDDEFAQLPQIECTYVSYVNDSTFGIPPLMGPAREGQNRATPGESVLYVNLAKVPAHHIERVKS